MSCSVKRGLNSSAKNIDQYEPAQCVQASNGRKLLLSSMRGLRCPNIAGLSTLMLKATIY